VGGQHSCAIRRWMSKDLPFAIPADTPKKITDRIHQALKKERLFHINYEDAYIPPDLLMPGTFGPCPWGLFDINDNNDLMPIGIYFYKDRYSCPTFVLCLFALNDTPLGRILSLLLPKMNLRFGYLQRLT
jgi:hypothetical protein